MYKFKPIFIEATTLNDVWHQLLINLYRYGRRYKITSGSREGLDRLAFDYVSGFIQYPHTRPLAPVMPEGLKLPAPTSDDKIETYFADYLMNSELAPKEHYKYAQWIVGDKSKGIQNQLEWVIKHFKDHGKHNEHCCITVGDSEMSKVYDIPYMLCMTCCGVFPKGTTVCPKCNYDLIVNEYSRGSTPCLRLLDFRIIDGYLTCHVVYRSWDLWSGFPENMGGFALLVQYAAEQLHTVKPGPLSFSCKSLHTYSDCFDILKMRLGK